MQDGKPIDGVAWAEDFDKRVDPTFITKIKEFSDGEINVYKQVEISESICLGAAILSMCLLVALACLNF